MKISDLISECISELKEEDYRGEHSAPEPSKSTAPLHDLTQNFDEDLYSRDAVRLYGNKLCDKCKVSKRYVSLYDYVSTCKHCSKEFGIDI